MDIKVKDLDGKEWMIPEDEAEDVKELHTNEVKEWYDDWESREGGRKGMRKGSKLARKGTRRGLAGDDVTDNRDYIEEVVPEEDDSYVVEGTDSPEGIERESETIDDQHNVVTDTDEGTEEEFLAESEEGDSEVIDEDGESREGRRRGHKGIRRGRRLGEYDEDELEEDLEELEEDTEEIKEDREGRRRGIHRGRRRGDAVKVIMDEEGNTESVDLPEPNEREGRRKGIRRGSRRGYRKGATMNWDGIDYEAIAGKLEKLGEDPWGLDFDDLFDLAESKGLTPDQFEREGHRRGIRKGSVYVGRSPEHQESIRSAVSVAMKDRRL